MKIATLTIIILAFALSANSQTSSRWKRMRYEVFFGAGATNFLGELGGANQIGTHFVKDFEFSQTRPVLSLGLRYRITETFSNKTMVSWGYVHGDDKTTKEEFRMNRNLNFRSPIAEFSTQFEYSIIKEKEGHRYNLRRVRGLRGLKTNTYFFIGFGGFYFNPSGKYTDKKWYKLRPMGTEGQGLVPTRPMYSNFSFCVPYGIGFKYGLNRKWNIGLEFGARKTFTDYIDDASTTYYDQQILYETKGAMAAYFSNPSLGTKPPETTAAYRQRGNSRDKDAYMFMILNLTYKIYTTRKGLPKFR